VAYFRIPNIAKALAGHFDGLIAQEPKNPYFPRAQGTDVVRERQVAERWRPTTKRCACNLTGALRTELGQVQIELRRPAVKSVPFPILSEGVRIEPDNSTAAFLGVAYGAAKTISAWRRWRLPGALSEGDKQLRAAGDARHPDPEVRNAGAAARRGS